jgi:Flp pilus assembly pilin Flp
MSTIEYFVLIAIVVVSIVGMEFCFKRALSARWKDTGDVFGFGRVYEHP